jgi:Protein of unknown function (DUF3300)
MNQTTRKLLILSSALLTPVIGIAQASTPIGQTPQQVQSTASDATVSSSAPDTSAQPAPFTTDELNNMVAPIALYPDALVAQVLGAATFPDQISNADQWLHNNSGLTGSALISAADSQSWDPSVKALTQFPSVLDNLANNSSWTSSLGQAFHYQQSQTMAAVQLMRAKAQDAGTLQSNAQIKVIQQNPQTIVIQPANPQVVYVPQYNPAVVYGAPVVVPYYVAPPVVGGVGIFFGSGISIGAAFGGGWGGGWAGGGWGWSAWNVNWGGGWGGGGGGNIIFNNNTYISNRTWNNSWNDRFHTWNGGTGVHPYNAATGTGYHPGADTQYGPGGHYHPNGYFGPDGHYHPGACPNCRNGGDNGNHGLIGGNGGVYHGANNGGTNVHPYNSATGNGYRPGDDTHYGPNGGYHPNGYFGPNGHFHQNNGGNSARNGNANGPDRNNVADNRGFNDNHGNNEGWNNHGRDEMNGDGNHARANSDRGRGSMNGSRQQHQQHPQRQPHGGGGSRGGGGRHR